MATIGQIKIGMSVGTSQLQKGLKSARGSLSKFSSKIGSVKGAIVGLGAVLGAGAVVAGLKSITSAALDSLDKLGKFSDEVGLTVHELQAFQLGATLTGVSTQTLEAGLQRLVRRLGEAKAGIGEGVTGLKLLGLRAEDLTQLSTADALKEIAEKISKLPGAADKAAAAYSLFGRQGQQLLTFLNAGKSGINDFVREAAELQGVKIPPSDITDLLQSLDSGNMAINDFVNKAQTVSGLQISPDLNMTNTEQLTQIAGQLNSIEDPAKRSAAAVELFGQSGQQLLDYLAQGKGSIGDFAKETESIQGGFDRIDVAQVEAANDAMAKIGFVVDSVGQQMAIQLSPIIENISTQIVELGKRGINAGTVVRTGLGYVAKGLGIVLDVVHTVKLGFMFMKAAVTTGISLILQSVAGLAQGLESLINLLPGVETSFTSTITAIADDMNKLAETQRDDAMAEFLKDPPSTALQNTLDAITQKSKDAATAIENSKNKINDFTAANFEAVDSASKLIQKLQDQVDVFGMTSNEAEIYRLTQAGVSEELIKQAQLLDDQLKALNDQKKVQDDLSNRAKSIFEETRTPMEKFKKEVAELDQLFLDGFIDGNTLNRATEKAFEKLPKPEIDTEVKLASASVRGSSEARSNILAFRNQNAKDQTPKNHLSEAKAQTQLLKTIASTEKIQNFQLN